MKNFATKFIVENWILNKCVSNRSRKKPFEFSFWWISRNRCIFMRNFARKFFVGNWVLKKCVVTRFRKKPFEFSFWRISRNRCIFIRNFARKFFVGNRILNKSVTSVQFLVNKSKSMHFYEKFCQEIFCRKLNFEQKCQNQGSEKNHLNSVIGGKVEFYAILWKILQRNSL